MSFHALCTARKTHLAVGKDADIVAVKDGDHDGLSVLKHLWQDNRHVTVQDILTCNKTEV